MSSPSVPADVDADRGSLGGGLVRRLAGRVLESDVPLEAAALHQALSRLVPSEAPLAGETVEQDVVDSLIGLGPLERLLRDPGVSDVLVNGPDEVWIDRSGRLERTTVSFVDDVAVIAAVERVIAPLGLRLDTASPVVDARLADGSRLHAAIPPAVVGGPVLALRRFGYAVRTMDDLVAAGSVDQQTADWLRSAVAQRRNLVVAGGTGSGKTTLLNVLSALIPPTERVVTVEDAAELQLVGHVVRLEGQPPNAEGHGEITLQRLVRSALRLRPDRIVVGEVRGAEALDMITAMNTGHAGSLSTVHANGPAEALWRLETLALAAPHQTSELAVRRQIWSAVDAVVMMRRADGRRHVGGVHEIRQGGEIVEVFA